jgi:neutral amino acid transport system permease protein
MHGLAIGLALLVRHLILLFFRGHPRPFLDFTVQRAIDLGPIRMTPRDLIVMALSLTVLVGVGLMLQKTKLGKAMRAVSDNRDLAESSGIDVEKVVGRVWIYGAGLAGLGGVLFANMFAFNHIRGFQLLLLMFAGIILGGLGTAFGAMLGSLVVGIIIEVSTVWFAPDLQWAWALGLLIIVLLVRPQGLLGRRERIG